MTDRSEKHSHTTSSSDSGRQTHVLMEEMRSQFNVVAEQYSSIGRRLDQHEVILSKVEMEVQIVKHKVGTIDAKVDNIERELDAVKEAVSDNSQRLDGVEQRLDGVGQKLETVVDSYHGRLKALETKIS
ncbi:MAG: hypothetical protein ABH845_05015 [Candidatus Omnitrophota bacterium]